MGRRHVASYGAYADTGVNREDDHGELFSSVTAISLAFELVGDCDRPGKRCFDLLMSAFDSHAKCNLVKEEGLEETLIDLAQRHRTTPANVGIKVVLECSVKIFSS